MKHRQWRTLLLCASLFFILHSSFFTSAHAQVGNLGKFDSRLLHYGIQVGYTHSKFDLEYTHDDALRETLQGTTSYYAPGFHIAVIGDLRLGNWFNLRILPGVTLITRDVNYSWEPNYLAEHHLAELSRKVESVYGDFPIEIKFRAGATSAPTSPEASPTASTSPRYAKTATVPTRASFASSPTTSATPWASDSTSSCVM